MIFKQKQVIFHLLQVRLSFASNPLFLRSSFAMPSLRVRLGTNKERRKSEGFTSVYWCFYLSMTSISKEFLKIMNSQHIIIFYYNAVL